MNQEGGESERMKEIIVNLKRFDVPEAMGGVWEGEDNHRYADQLLGPLVGQLERYADIRFTFFLPELHLIRAAEIAKGSKNVRIGCQSNSWEDVGTGGFGAFTSLRCPSAMWAAGCAASLIGHCEERAHLRGIAETALAGLSAVQDRRRLQETVCQVLNREIRAALAAGLDVCYCIGESEQELSQWDEVLLTQLEIGLRDVDREARRGRLIIGYEPLWSIGPGKTPADAAYIRKVLELIHSWDSSLPVIYGGGVKEENARMLGGIDALSGGLIALTSFSGRIGFHPEEFLRIVELYGAVRQKGGCHEAGF